MKSKSAPHLGVKSLCEELARTLEATALDRVLIDPERALSEEEDRLRRERLMAELKRQLSELSL